MITRGYYPQPDMETPPPASGRDDRDRPDPPDRSRDDGGDRQRMAMPDAPDAGPSPPSDDLALSSLDRSKGGSSLFGIRLLDYEGLSLFDLSLKFGAEAGPALNFEKLPSYSLNLDAKSLKDGASGEYGIPTGIGGTELVFGAGMDGSKTVGLGWSPTPLRAHDSPLPGIAVGGAQIYAYTACPDTGPCFDAGAKLRAGPVTVKAEVGVSTGPGYDALAGDIGRAIVRALQLPLPPGNTLPY